MPFYCDVATALCTRRKINRILNHMATIYPVAAYTEQKDLICISSLAVSGLGWTSLLEMFLHLLILCIICVF